MATVYAVASAKGGVGKTTTTAAIATILAGSGADVVAIDADIGMANLAGALGVTPGETTLHDVLAGRADPLDAVHEGPEGLLVVPGSDDLDAYASADPEGLTDVVAAFEDADYVFVDAGAGLSHDSSLPLAIADETLLVSTAELSALGDTEKTRQLAERLGGAVAGAAITRVDPDSKPGEAGADGLGAVGDVLDAPVLGRIPEDDAVVRAATANRPLPTFAPDAPATRAYRDLTRALTGAAIEGAGVGETDEADETGKAEDRGAPEPDEESEGGSGERDGDEHDTDDAIIDADDGDDADDEEIIVADAESGGLSDPGGEEEIIVADEDPVSEGEGEGKGETTDTADREGDDETTGDVPPEPAAADETETVGEEHVDGDDLEAMIDEDEAEAFADAEAGSSDGDEASSEDTKEAATTGGDEEESTDPDDELAGSVPFRDDDTGPMNTVLSEENEDESGGEAADDEDETDGESETGDEKEGGGGFFSRLFGR